MKLVEFSDQNVVFAKHQPEYLQLPAHKFEGDSQGRIVFCWRMTWRERFKILVSGTLWHQVLTFDQPLQPQLLETNRPDMTPNTET